MAGVPELPPRRRVFGLPTAAQLRRSLAVPAEQQRDGGAPAVPGLRPPVVGRHPWPRTPGPSAAPRRLITRLSGAATVAVVARRPPAAACGPASPAAAATSCDRGESRHTRSGSPEVRATATP